MADEVREIKHRAPGGGRKKAEINKLTFERLCYIQCTRDEIAFALGVSINTLERWIKDTYDGLTFKEVFKKVRQGGFVSLRRNLFKMAATSPKVLLFMATNYLGLTTENPQSTNTNISDSTISSFTNVIDALQDRSETLTADNFNQEEKPNNEA